MTRAAVAINVATMPNTRVSTSLTSMMEGGGPLAGELAGEGSIVVCGQPPSVPGYLGISMLRCASTRTEASSTKRKFWICFKIYIMGKRKKPLENKKVARWRKRPLRSKIIEGELRVPDMCVCEARSSSRPARCAHIYY